MFSRKSSHLSPEISRGSIKLKLIPIINEIQAEVLAEIQARKKSAADNETIKKQIYEILCKKTIYNKIRNYLSESIERAIDRPWKDQSAVDKLQTKWLKRAQKGLQNMCSDLKLPMTTNRKLSQRIKLEEKWNELGTADELDTSHLRPVFSSKDMLEFLKSIDGQAFGVSNRSESAQKSWKVLENVPCSTATYRDLQTIFKELKLSSPKPEYQEKMAEKVLQFNDAVVAQNFCRQGCPTGFREKIWQLALQSEPNQKDFFAFKCLKQEFFRWDLVVDRLIFKDIKETASNDDQYFVFEDLLYQILFIFLRKRLLPESENSDTQLIRKHVLAMSKLDTNSAPIGSENPAVIPFFGFSFHAAPLCFVSIGPVRCIKTFSKMYDKFFYKLQTITNDYQSILCLTKLFEELLAKEEPKISEHLERNALSATALAFKWIMRAFSGHLSSEEVLSLWDRMIGFSNLTILPVLAVAIFAQHREKILQTTTQEEMISIFRDLTNVSFIETVQAFLFKSY